jgi:uncharacterized protein YehS (DUF1456 family)
MSFTNEVLGGIKQALNLSYNDIENIYAEVSFPIETKEIERFFKAPTHKSFKQVSYEALGSFLDGLIAFKRGEPSRQSSHEIQTLTTNLILKKIRIALNLKEHEIEIIFNLADIFLTKQQLASLFRKEEHKNFRACSHELLLAFLVGLDEYFFVDANSDAKG